MRTKHDRVSAEKRVGEYSKSGVGIDQADQSFALDALRRKWNDDTHYIKELYSSELGNTFILSTTPPSHVLTLEALRK
jgi:hypothetical protein